MAMICTRCGTARENASRVVKGSGSVELLLWLCGILPGLVYHLWRSGSKTTNVCPACGSETIVPMESPVGRELQQRFGVTLADVQQVAASESSDLKNGYVALLVIGVVVVVVILAVYR